VELKNLNLQFATDAMHLPMQLARRYHAVTGKPLGITGEVAEYEVARILGVQLTPARNAGYDATENVNGRMRRLQMQGALSPARLQARLTPGFHRHKKKWDAVLRVLLEENFDATEIHEANRQAVAAALAVPRSKARNERGALGVKFKAIGKLRWRRRA